MTSLILLVIGTGAAGFIVGALLVHWAYRPVRYERNEYEHVPPGQLPTLATLARTVDCKAFVLGKPEYKDGEPWQPKHKIPSTCQQRRCS